MKSYLRQLTKQNWGFPWHILIAAFLTQVAFIALEGTMSEPLAILVSLVGVNGLGWLYEEYQIRWAGNTDKKDRLQDLIGNAIGSVAEVLLILYTAPDPLDVMYQKLISQIVYYAPDPVSVALVQLLY
jgi:hypothetical protein